MEKAAGRFFGRNTARQYVQSHTGGDFSSLPAYQFIRRYVKQIRQCDQHRQLRIPVAIFIALISPHNDADFFATCSCDNPEAFRSANKFSDNFMISRNPLDMLV